MNLQEKNFISLLRASVLPGLVPQLEEPDYDEILSIAERHAVTGLLYPGLKKCLSPQDPLLSQMKKRSFGAATSASIRKKELGKIYDLCNNRELPVLPLKGCIIKELYPYPELRTMSDADLLIPPAGRSAIRKGLEDLGFRFHKVDAADTDVYISPLSLNYEIHLDLTEEGFSSKSRDFCARLLELSKPAEAESFVMALPPEEHYIYILCHFIKHFIYGGIGIRQLTDLYICYSNWGLDLQKVRDLLEELELSSFHNNLKALWEHWFLETPSTDTTEALGSYILHSGVFGNEEQRATDRLLSAEREGNYIFSRLFPPYRLMKGYFPILRKLPFLLPFAWIWRAFRAVLFRRKKLTAELNAMSATDAHALNSKRQFYRHCGLSVYDKTSDESMK